MKLGDLFFYLTYYTGIHWLVKKISKLFNKDCGCDRRREEWNDIELWKLKIKNNGKNLKPTLKVG